VRGAVLRLVEAMATAAVSAPVQKIAAATIQARISG
jgi:hypothetical protein